MKVKWNPLGPITAAIEKKALDRLETAAEQVAERARVLVPVGRKGGVDTGTLKNTIRVVRLKGDPKLNVRVYAGNRKRRAEGGAFYAHMIEYGTVKMKAKPFLRPALNASKTEIKTIVGAE